MRIAGCKNGNWTSTIDAFPSVNTEKSLLKSAFKNDTDFPEPEVIDADSRVK